MFFASDNWAGAHPLIAEKLGKNASGFSAGYGSGDLDKQVYRTFSEIFEREVAVFFVATGTAANALSLSSVNRPGGVTFCHRGAHIVEDECGAPEFFTGGARLCPVDGPLGRMEPALLRQAIARYPAEFVHSGQPMAISITQATEMGTLFSLDDIETISAIASENGLPLHMDGARFANALVALDTTPAEMTWKRGVDILSFGGTKNGCWCAEAVVLFDLDKAKEFAFLRKRAGQLFSKSRFISAQFDAYFEGGLWLETARHANAMATKLADAIGTSGSARLGWEPQANEVFPILKKSDVERLKAEGAVFYDWHAPVDFDGEIASDETLCRLVTSFATTDEDVERFAATLAR
ncbi:threonine aldolase family protein [Oryzicola mucosus]|uniref:L-threonine aldolase n=1 Tax=Oryzicola mucosus TaxID=2767425 RepID=A0A8J6PU49_9HYPH|nr:low specificity L-threonine aldolase [Oryzicola mucosus]MBD0414406.1 low specificity L-threonine aldolase [Oryzicola mucosus]